jgi:hypothetical protein
MTRLRNPEIRYPTDRGRAVAGGSEASGDPGARTASLKSAILEQGIVLESVPDLGGALGTSSGGRIRLLNGLSPAVEFTTLVHEYAHELLHHSGDRPARNVSLVSRTLHAARL